MKIKMVGLHHVIVYMYVSSDHVGLGYMMFFFGGGDVTTKFRGSSCPPPPPLKGLYETLQLTKAEQA